MKTDTLIDFLATGAGTAPRSTYSTRFVLAALGGLAGSIALGFLIHGFLPVSALSTPGPWFKIVYAAALLLSAWRLLVHLAKPVAPVARPMVVTVAIVALMAACGIAALWNAPPDERAGLFWGQTWLLCPVLILLCGLPALGFALWTLRSLAPTRLRFAGFAAGVFSGALGVLGYSLGCPEASPLFIAFWYTLGIVLNALLGLQLGPRLLRW